MNRRTLSHILILGATLWLGACQSFAPDEESTELATNHLSWEHTTAGCSAQDCPLVNVELQRLSNQPQLDARIEATLLDMVYKATGQRAHTLQQHEQEFLASAKPGWVSYLQAKVLEQHAKIVVIELSSYHFTGGVQGIPGRRYLNVDRHSKQVLEPKDILVAGEETAFWQVAERAHQAWLVSQGHAEDTKFQQNWPFKQTQNIAFLRSAVMLKYDVGQIAPYADGHPQILIPYSELQGIVRPAYITP